MDQKVATVVIGGINASNLQRAMFQSKASFKGLDGVAVVSAIVCAEDPKAEASKLRRLVGALPPFVITHGSKTTAVSDLLAAVPDVVKKLVQLAPLCHNMTNLVVQNFAANVALSM